MRVWEVMAALSKLPADMPVVVAQEDTPLGDYGVAGVEVATCYRDENWSSYREVWEHSPSSRADKPVEVAYLSIDEPPAVVVDADAEPPAEVTAPSAGELGPPPAGFDLAALQADLADLASTAEQPRLVTSPLDYAELKAMGWLEVGTTPEGGWLLMRPTPRVTIELTIAEDWRAGALLSGGANGELHANLDDAVRCAGCDQAPEVGQVWLVELARNPVDAAWRHSPACP